MMRVFDKGEFHRTGTEEGIAATQRRRGGISLSVAAHMYRARDSVRSNGDTGSQSSWIPLGASWAYRRVSVQKGNGLGALLKEVDFPCCGGI
ncbi:unnamed protein product [Clonostachys byssicola]|uniref:Uncharacterized protein n=1 Tax=Clonostachys byssicola TaxID=160290 RepID=A0A9N9YBH0_9HYPO|nr:unnamed protein product [Clonostachys byssicola]